MNRSHPISDKAVAAEFRDDLFAVYNSPPIVALGAWGSTFRAQQLFSTKWESSTNVQAVAAAVHYREFYVDRDVNSRHAHGGLDFEIATNNNNEGANKEFKADFKGELLSAAELCEYTFNFAQSESIKRAPTSANFAQYAWRVQPVPGRGDWSKALGWSLRDDIKIKGPTNSGQVGRYVVLSAAASGTLTVDIALSLLATYDAMNFSTMGAFVKFRESVHVITPVPLNRAENFIGPFSCDCPKFLKSLFCTHSLGLALKLKKIPGPLLGGLELGRRKRGAPRKAVRGALHGQPTAVRHLNVDQPGYGMGEVIFANAAASAED
jgi:hypothetical protein